MRPVNLIPKDAGKRGDALRKAPIAYLLVAALALGLGAVTMLVLTNNKIADRKAEIADLNNQVAAIQQQATQLQPFINFRTAEQQRITAIRDLANSRIDWNRVMQELARVLPNDVSLDSLNASTGGDDATASSGTGAAGPTLAMSGCAKGHESVAGFLAALKDIDGVTDVALGSSQRGSAGAGAGTGATTGSGGCPGNFTTFQLTATLGSAPSAQPADAAAAPAAAPVGTAPAPAPATTDTTNASAVTPAG